MCKQSENIVSKMKLKIKRNTEPIVRHRLIRLIIAHILCAIHMGLSIYVLYTIKAKTYLYFIPMFGTILFGVEAILSLVCYRCKEYFRGFSVLVLVYSITIIGSIWVLELHRINELKQNQWKIIPISFQYFPTRFGGMPGTFMKPGDFLNNFKYVWSQVEIQVYLLLLLILRALLPKQDSISYYGKTDILFKYFATGMDLIDFIDLLTYPQLYFNSGLVYATLSVWSVSCLQFIIYVPEYKNDKLKELHSFLTNSLVTAFLMDIPFLIVRIYAIFGCGKHDYTSYFFVFKNLVVILLQIARIQAVIVEKSHHRKDELAKLTYIPQPPFNTRAKSQQLSNNRGSGARIILSNYSQNNRNRQSGDGRVNNMGNVSNV